MVLKSNQSTQLPILADTWYGCHYPDICESFEDLLKNRFPPWLGSVVRRSEIVRGSLFFFIARKYPYALTNASLRARAFLFLEALFGSDRKHVILVEFIQSVRPNSESVVKRLIYFIWIHWILRRALQKCLMKAHVLTEWESSYYADLFKIPKERFKFIPWPKRGRADQFVKVSTVEECQRYVVSSGREACDWETLFKAAEGQAWHLRVICSRRDLPRVSKLNRTGFADVLCEISKEDHDCHVQNAAVYVLSLLERERSSGHVRISNATRAGTPIVATAVKGIEGYITGGETGILVPPGEPLYLREAVNQLLADHTFRRAMAKNAWDRAANHTREDYKEKIGLLIRSAVQSGLQTATEIGDSKA